MIPKFRAWDKENKFMVTNFHRSHMKIETGKVLYQLTTTNENEIKAIASYNTFDDYIYRYSHDLELMQSTGLKGYMSDSYQDDEEKDVYRGDIIDIFWEEWPMGYYQENHMIGLVDKDETGTAWIIKDAKYAFNTPEPIPSEVDGISVSMSLPDAEDLEEIFLHNFNLTSSDITILGNIYENPELLEQANEN